MKAAVPGVRAGLKCKQKQTERINVFRAFFNVKGHIKNIMN